MRCLLFSFAIWVSCMGGAWAQNEPVSDFDLWFAPPPRLVLDENDKSKISPELAAMLHPRAGGGHLIDGENDETFKSCRASVSARAGFGVIGSVLGATNSWRVAFAGGTAIGKIRSANSEYRGCVEIFPAGWTERRC